MRKAVNILIKRSDDTEQEIMLYPGDTWEVDGRFILTCAEEPKSVSAKLPSPPSPVFKIGDNVRYKGTANTGFQGNNELEPDDVYKVAQLGLLNDGTILLEGKTSWYGIVHFELVASLPTSPDENC